MNEKPNLTPREAEMLALLEETFKNLGAISIAQIMKEGGVSELLATTVLNLRDAIQKYKRGES